MIKENKLKACALNLFTFQFFVNKLKNLPKFFGHLFSLHPFFWTLPQILKLEGDEKVLDVGCGLGRMTIAVAKRLNEGKVIGVDIWDKMEIPGNSPENAYANAEIEGVRDKVEFRTGNVLDLPFPDNSFDLVTSASVINNLHSLADKSKALKEIFRVLKLLKNTGFINLRYLYRNGAGIFLVKKSHKNSIIF